MTLTKTSASKVFVKKILPPLLLGFLLAVAYVAIWRWREAVLDSAADPAVAAALDSAVSMDGTAPHFGPAIADSDIDFEPAAPNNNGSSAGPWSKGGSSTASGVPRSQRHGWSNVHSNAATSAVAPSHAEPASHEIGGYSSSEDVSHQPKAFAAGRQTLSGRVLDDLGRLLPAMRVSLQWQPAARTEDRAQPAQERQSTLSDDNGIYSFYHLADGEYTVRAEGSKRYAPTVAITAAGTRGADLILKEVTISATNTGNIHMQIASLQIDPVVNAALPAEHSLNTYLLPGQTHTWPLAVATKSNLNKQLKLLARTDAGDIRAEIPFEAR